MEKNYWKKKAAKKTTTFKHFLQQKQVITKVQVFFYNWHILKFFHTGLIQVQISKPQNVVSVKTEKNHWKNSDDKDHVNEQRNFQTMINNKSRLQKRLRYFSTISMFLSVFALDSSKCKVQNFKTQSV